MRPSPLKTALWTALALLAFASNSLLCRLALRDTGIDPGSFTAVRLVSGALMLALLVALRAGVRLARASFAELFGGSWLSALALFAYAAAFSWAYVSLPAGTGALLLFGAVQATMILAGLRQGERFTGRQALGLSLALAGLVGLVMPGLQAPPFAGSALMILAGAAWGVYTLRGRGRGRGGGGSDPIAATAGNFLRAAPLGLALGIGLWGDTRLDPLGAGYAAISGAVSSGLGYTVWYTALRGLSATRAAVLQLLVPVLAAAGGVFFLAESWTLRLTLTGLAIVGGVALATGAAKA